MPHPSSSRLAFPRPPRGRTLPLRLRRALATLGAVAAHQPGASAAVIDAVPGHTTWAILAALGLLAVVIAALTVTRPRDEEPDEAADEGTAPPAASGPPPADFARELAADAAHVTPAPEARPVETADFALALPAAIRTRRAGGERAAIAAPPLSVDASSAAPAPEVVARAVPAAAFATGERAAPASLEPAADGPAIAQASASQLFLALHHVDLSIDVLRRHLAEESRPMPAVWVMLLDLCRTHGREQTFRDIAGEFHARFNVCTPTWEHYPPDRSEPGLEAYPRIVRELTLSWGTHECRRLLDRLLYDTRSGERRGFTINAYNDLIALRRAADAVLHSIEQDLDEESRVRHAFAQAAVDAANDDALPEPPAPSPLVRDLETKLDADLRDGEDMSALEHEHPALVDALVRDWGSAALAGRLCEMLARDVDGAHALSGESRNDVELLRSMAERLADAKRMTVAAD